MWAQLMRETGQVHRAPSGARPLLRLVGLGDLVRSNPWKVSRKRMKIQRERNQPSGGFSRGPAASQQGSEGQGSHEGQAEK